MSRSGGALTKTAADGTYAPLGTNVIDLCIAPYNATPGQDCTSALQSAINALAALGGGDILFSKVGTYLLNGTPQTGTALTYAYNGQVLFPAVTWLNKANTPIRIRGVAPASSGALSTGQASGVILQSNASGAYMFDCVPAEAQWSWQWTGVMPIFENIILRSPTGGTAGGVNAACALRARYERVQYDVVANVGSAPTGPLKAFVSPHGLNNGDITYRDVNIRGAFTGIKLEEHVVLDNVEIIACTNAFEGGEDYHTTTFQYVDVEECANIFHMPAGSGALQVDGSMDVEAVVSNGAWNAPCYLVSPTSTASPSGSLRINLIGSTTGSLALGATAWNLDTVCLFTGASVGDQGGLGGWRSKHPIENFTRLQGLSITGSGPGQCFPTLHPWRLGTGTFSLVATQLKSLTAGNWAQAFVPARNGGENRRITAGITTGSAGYLASLFAHRVTGGTNAGKTIEVRLNGVNVLLIVNGTTRVTIPSSITTATAYTLATDVLYNADGLPSVVKVWLGSTLLTTYALPAADIALLASTGASYPYIEDGLGLFSDTTSYFTSFAVKGIAPDPSTDLGNNAHPGVVAPTQPGWGGGGSALPANTALLARFVPSRRMTVSMLAFAVSTAAGSNDNVDVGIYDASMARLASSGATAGKLNSTGVQTVSLSASVVLQAGVAYYAAIVSGPVGTTGTTIRSASFSNVLATQLFGSAAGVGEAFTSVTSYPLPSTLASPVIDAVAPVLAVRES